MNIISSFLRMTFSLIDKIVYGFISDVYILIVQLSDVRVFDDATLGNFATRMYGLIAIFMAFKLIFSFVNYAVNPDSLTNEKTGGKKLVTNIIVSLVLLIAVPGIIFPLSRDIQTAILRENVIPSVILGTKNSSAGGTDPDQINLRMGRMISYSVMSSFFTIDSSICPDTNFIVANPDGNYGDGTADSDPSLLKNLVWQVDDSENCRTKLMSAIDSSYGDTEVIVQNYERSYNQFSVKILLGGSDEYDLKLLKTADEDYVFDYNFFISTIAGVFVAWMLIVIGFKIAVRVIKLAFLELIAPVPIISYIDEKSKSKSFDGWVKTCISTYLDLFIRLIALFFFAYIVGELTLNLTFNTMEGTPGGLVKVFIIIGALMFAEQLPKLIQEIFGVNADGGFSLNPLKGSKLATRAVGGAAVLGAGSILSGTSNFLAAKSKNKDINDKISKLDAGDPKDQAKIKELQSQRISGKRMFGSTIGGAVSGGIRGAYGVAKTGKVTSSMNSGIEKISSIREQNAVGNKLPQRLRTKAATMMNIPNSDDGGEFSKLQKDLKQMKRDHSDLQAAETAMEKRRMELYVDNSANLRTMLQEDNTRLKQEYVDAGNAEAAWEKYAKTYKDAGVSDDKIPLDQDAFTRFYNASIEKEKANAVANSKEDEIKTLENRLKDTQNTNGGSK